MNSLNEEQSKVFGQYLGVSWSADYLVDVAVKLFAENKIEQALLINRICETFKAEAKKLYDSI